MQPPAAFDPNFCKAVELSKDQVEYGFSPINVIRALNSIGVRFVLVGVFGLVGWLKEPRASQFIDVRVSPRRRKQAAIRLFEATEDAMGIGGGRDCVKIFRSVGSSTPAVRIHAREKPKHEVMLRHSLMVDCCGQEFRIPNLEFAIASTYASMKR